MVATRRPSAAGTGTLFGLVALNIALQLVNAGLIKYASRLCLSGPMLLVLALVMALSFGRFAVWNAMHRRYPVSVAYPATALFFPCLVALAYLLGEPVSARQVAGVALVTAGVLALVLTRQRDEAGSA